jgi:hypothetical protein
MMTLPAAESWRRRVISPDVRSFSRKGRIFFGGKEKATASHAAPRETFIREGMQGQSPGACRLRHRCG